MVPIVPYHSWAASKPPKLIDSYLAPHIEKYQWIISSIRDSVSTFELDQSKVLSTNDIWLLSANVKGLNTAVDIDVEKPSQMTLGTLF